MKSEKVAFGVITRSLNQLSPFLNFLKNAKKYNHKIKYIIFGYQDIITSEIVYELKKHCEVVTIQRGNSDYLLNTLQDLKLTKKEIDALIATPYKEKYDMVSYGTARNYVLIAAILMRLDFLIFFDTDVYPKILFEDKENRFYYEEIDFVGSHLKLLHKYNDVVVTTSDYSGYYIIPKMNFPHLNDLLYGVQKENSFNIISHENKLVIKHNHQRNIHKTNKILGGNLAIDLRKLKLLSPFFSTNLVMDGECFLGRGEDTLFGPLINKYGGRCLDIDLPIFHNCFGDFPNVPDIFQKKNLDRFFYACMGWIIRNPFYNWIHPDNKENLNEEIKKKRYDALIKGSQKAAEYFNDIRFLKLPKAFKLSYHKLPENIEKFHRLLDAWNNLKNYLKDNN